MSGDSYLKHEMPLGEDNVFYNQFGTLEANGQKVFRLSFRAPMRPTFIYKHNRGLPTVVTPRRQHPVVGTKIRPPNDLLRMRYYEKMLAKPPKTKRSKRDKDVHVYQLPASLDLPKCLRRMFKKPEFADCEIKIDDVVFKCNMMLLKCYAKYFRTPSALTQRVFELPSNHVSPSIFAMAYNWMLQVRRPLVKPDNIHELFKASYFLGLDGLKFQCWYCFDLQNLYDEDTACVAYLKEKQLGLDLLAGLMMGRVNKFFLTFVASRDFLDLRAVDVCAILKLNTIGVNSEIEVLMTAVRWLIYDWEKRQSSMMDVIHCVRFGLMPKWFLSSLNMKRDYGQINCILHDPKVLNLVKSGLTYALCIHYCQNNFYKFVMDIEAMGLIKLPNRQWIYDPDCTYHHNAEDKTMKFVNYEMFTEYLSMLNTGDPDHWQTLEKTTLRVIEKGGVEDLFVQNAQFLHKGLKRTHCN